MTSSWSVIISCLLLASQGLADMDNNQQIMEMMSKMKAAMIFEVEERVETKLRAEMKEKEEVMRENVEKVEVMREVMKEEMQEKVDVMREEMQEKDKEMKEVKKQLDTLESKNVELTTKLKEVDQKSLRDLPFILTCAFQDHWTTPSATITYDRLTVDYNNSDRPGGGDGEMDINTGKLTALTAGHYTITYSG